MGTVVERRLEGDEPFVWEPGVLTPLSGPDWKARIRSLHVDGARADYVEIDPYRFEVPALAERPEGPVQMLLVVILSGSSSGEVDGRRFELNPKRAALIDMRATLRVEAPVPVRAVRLFVDEDHFSDEVLASPGLPLAVLKDSPLVAGVVGLVTGLLQVGNPTVEPHDELAVSRPLIALQASLLDEALLDGHRSARVEPSEARRERIEVHIEQHLGDHALSVRSIAQALDVAPRTVHAAFADAPETVAAYIRRRRIARAQTLLALRDEAPNVAALAAKVGLSRDQLTRGFQAATGGTAVDWWHRHRPERARG